MPLKTKQVPPTLLQVFVPDAFQRKRAFLLFLRRHFIFMQWKPASSALGETPYPALATSSWKVGLVLPALQGPSLSGYTVGCFPELL